MKTIAPFFVTAVLAGTIVFLLMKGCQKSSSVPDASQQIMAGAKAGYDSARRVDSPALAILARQKDSVANVNDVLSQEIVDMQSGLQQRAGDIAATLSAGDHARVIHDTVKIVQNCDSLGAEVKSGIPAIQAFAVLTDSMVHASEARASIQDSIIARLQRDNAVAQATIGAQERQYDLVHKDDVSKTAQLKIYRPVAIGGVGILVAAIVIKFLIK